MSYVVEEELLHPSVFEQESTTFWSESSTAQLMLYNSRTTLEDHRLAQLEYFAKGQLFAAQFQVSSDIDAYFTRRCGKLVCNVSTLEPIGLTSLSTWDNTEIISLYRVILSVQDQCSPWKPCYIRTEKHIWIHMKRYKWVNINRHEWI